MRKLFAFLGSVKLFVGLALYLVVLSAVASLFPQGASTEQYVARYGESGARALTVLGLHNYATSALFVVPIVLLEASLLICTIPRFAKRVRRLRRKGMSAPADDGASVDAASAAGDGSSPSGRTSAGGKRLRYLAFAPDIIHFGLAVLIVGGALSFALREYEDGFAFVGETIQTEPLALVVESAEEIRNDDGHVIDWRVDLAARRSQTNPNAGAVNQDASRRIVVGANKPVNVLGYRVHFRDYREVPVLPVAGADGRTVDLGLGEGFFAGDSLYILFDVDQESPLFYEVDAEEVEALEQNSGGNGIRGLIDTAPIVRIREDSIVGGIAVGSVRLETRVAVSVTRDPGGLPVLLGFLILALGLILFVIKKAVDRG